MPRNRNIEQFQGWQQMPPPNPMFPRNEEKAHPQMMNQQSPYHWSFGCNDKKQFNAMSTLKPYQWNMLQREHPEAYMLICQQRYLLQQEREQLNIASKEVFRLRKMLNSARTRSSSSLVKNKHDDDDGDVKDSGDFLSKDDISEKTPPAMIQKSQSLTLPHSPLTDAYSLKSLPGPPLKRRILDATDEHYYRKQVEISYHNDYDSTNVNLQSRKRSRTHLPNITQVAAALSALTSPLHEEPPSKFVVKKKASRPDIATVAATLAAATSPVFQEITPRTKRNSFTEKTSFGF